MCYVVVTDRRLMQMFYNSFRLANIHPKIGQMSLHGQQRSAKTIWVPRSQEESDSNPCTKLCIIRDIIRHHIGPAGSTELFLGEDHPNVCQKAEVMVAYSERRSLDVISRVPPRPPIKVLIFCSWKFIEPMLKAIFSFWDLPAAFINGSTPPQKRAEMISAFNLVGPHSLDDGKESWILVISGVGGTGINLPRGSVCIFAVRVTKISCPFDLMMYIRSHVGLVVRKSRLLDDFIALVKIMKFLPIS